VYVILLVSDFQNILELGGYQVNRIHRRRQKHGSCGLLGLLGFFSVVVTVFAWTSFLGCGIQDAYEIQIVSHLCPHRSPFCLIVGGCSRRASRKKGIYGISRSVFYERKLLRPRVILRHRFSCICTRHQMRRQES